MDRLAKIVGAVFLLCLAALAVILVVAAGRWLL